MESPIFELRNVSKHLGGKTVLDAIDYQWNTPGALVIVGENGAGKSTLLRLMAGIGRIDGGEISVCGFSLQRDRVRALRQFGYLPESPELPTHLSVEEFVALTASLKQVSSLPNQVDTLIGLDAIRTQRLGTLSLGQRRRACLAAALLGDPAVVAMDEPTNGLDLDGLTMLAQVIRMRTERGLSTVLATHDRAFMARVEHTRVDLRAGKIQQSSESAS